MSRLLFFSRSSVVGAPLSSSFQRASSRPYLLLPPSRPSINHHHQRFAFFPSARSLSSASSFHPLFSSSSLSLPYKQQKKRSFCTSSSSPSPPPPSPQDQQRERLQQEFRELQIQLEREDRELWRSRFPKDSWSSPPDLQLGGKVDEATKARLLEMLSDPDTAYDALPLLTEQMFGPEFAHDPNITETKILEVAKTNLLRELDTVKVSPGQYRGQTLSSSSASSSSSQPIPHGHGISRSKDGNTIYRGVWQHGQRHGLGTLWSKGQSFYLGYFLEGKRDGRGLFHSEEMGSIYSGDWKDDKFHGLGKLTMPTMEKSGAKKNEESNNSYFLCQWREGFPHDGTFFDAATKTTYEGTWKFVEEGESYEDHPYTRSPEEEKDIREHVREQFEEMDEYVESAEGSHIRDNERTQKHEQEIIQHLRDVEEQRRLRNERMQAMKLPKGRLCGHGTIYFANGNVYNGVWEDFIPEGPGEMIFVNGHRYNGDFKHGRFHGYGYMKYNDGSSYNGTWKYDLRHGVGEYVDKVGRERIGPFANDTYLLSKDEPQDDFEYDLSLMAKKFRNDPRIEFIARKLQERAQMVDRQGGPVKSEKMFQSNPFDDENEEDVENMFKEYEDLDADEEGDEELDKELEALDAELKESEGEEGEQVDWDEISREAEELQRSGGFDKMLRELTEEERQEIESLRKESHELKTLLEEANRIVETKRKLIEKNELPVDFLKDILPEEEAEFLMSLPSMGEKELKELVKKHLPGQYKEWVEEGEEKAKDKEGKGEQESTSMEKWRRAAEKKQGTIESTRLLRSMREAEEEGDERDSVVDVDDFLDEWAEQTKALGRNRKKQPKRAPPKKIRF
ncbi:Acylphosphatase [Balamuthia mandrillaris]